MTRKRAESYFIRKQCDHCEDTVVVTKFAKCATCAKCRDKIRAAFKERRRAEKWAIEGPMEVYQRPVRNVK